MGTCGSNFDTKLKLSDNSTLIESCDDCGFGPTASCGMCCGATLPVSTDSSITSLLTGGNTYYYEMDYNPKTPHGDILTYHVDVQCVTGNPTPFPTTSPTRWYTHIPTGVTGTPTVSPVSTRSPTINSTRTPTIEGERRKLFVVQVSTLQTRVNVKDRIGLVGDVINYDVTQLSNMYFEWSESNGLLNNSELINYSDNVYDITSQNLILTENVLTSGNIYSFILTVEQYKYPLADEEIILRRRRLAIVNNTLIGYGESAAIEIYVYRTPTVHNNSFKVVPKCDNVYASIYDLLTTKHSLTLSADDDFVPLMYEFGYNKSTVTNYFHPSLLSDSTIYNVFLPVGEFKIFGNVINSVSSKSTEYNNCSIQLLDYSQCIVTWKVDIIDDYIAEIVTDYTYSIDEVYSYIFSQTDIYLNYLYEYIPTNNTDRCVEESIKQIIDTLDEYVDITCDTYRWSVSLAQTMSLLMNLITLNNSSLSDTFYTREYLIILKDLLFDTMDPCGCIVNFTHIEDLYLLGESIINQVPAVYYGDTDITDCLSPIISDPNYQHLLYHLASPVITLMNSGPYNESSDIYDLLIDAIYIAELALISTNIPQTLICSDYSDISSCTFRIDNKCDDLNAQNISLHVGNSRIYIPNDITCDDEQDTDLTWVAVSFPGAAMELVDDDTTAAAATTPGCDRKTFLENSLSITISLGGNLTNHSVTNFDQSQLVDNIEFSFSCYGKCNDSFECVWFDTENSTWSKDGCNTHIIHSLNEILCQCDIHSELTPFATVHTPSYRCEDPFTNGWLDSVIWDILLWIFFSIFMLIFCYAMFLCYRYYFTFEWRNISVFAIWLIGITALIYAFICLFGYLTQQTILTLRNDERTASGDSGGMIQLYTLFLLIPQFTYFIIFSIIFYSWYSLIHSVFLPDIDNSQKRKKLNLQLILINIILFGFLIIYIIFVFRIEYPSNHSIFVVGTLIWCFLLILLSIVYIIYGCLIHKFIYKTGKAMTHLYDTKQSVSTTNNFSVNLLFLLAISIAIYYIFLCLSSIYFAGNPSQNQSVDFMIIYYIMAIIFLLYLLFMYKDYIYKQATQTKIIAENMNGNMNGSMNGSGDFDDLNAPFVCCCHGKNKKTKIIAKNMNGSSDLGAPLTPPEQQIEMNGTYNIAKNSNTKEGVSTSPTPMQKQILETIHKNKSQPSLIIPQRSQRSLPGINEDSMSLQSTEKMINNNNIEQHVHEKNMESLIVLDFDFDDLNEIEKERLEEEKTERLAAEQKERERLKKEAEEKEKKRLEEEKIAEERQLKREESLLNHLMDDIMEDKHLFDDWDKDNSENSEYSDIDDELDRLDAIDEEKNDIKEKPKHESINDLLQIELPKDVENILGAVSKIKIPKKKKDVSMIERDLRKIFSHTEEDEKYTKLALLKWYDILIETFIKYCKIGGDRDWLTIQGWEALYKDAYIADKKIINPQCTEKECYELFNIIYDKHNMLFKSKKMSLRHSQILKKGKNKFSTRTLILDEWNDDDPWSGIWVSQDEDSDETYILKQIGDKKIIGYIKSFEFCDINGSLRGVDKTKCEMMVFWHKGARRNRRRLCRCILNKPNDNQEGITMTIQWKSIAVSSIVDQISKEKGIYTMVKMKKDLTNKQEDSFKYKIGLARHEYLDAMLELSKMKFNKFQSMEKYHKLNKLCEDNLIPYIWGGMENAQNVSLKQIFRPYSTELHRLFDKYNIIDSSKQGTGNALMNINEWVILCADILKQDKNAFLNGGKPTQLDIKSSYEVAKEGYDLLLTYRIFEKALANLAHKTYKRQPKAKYNFAMRYGDKLKKLLKWAKKLEKSGYIPQQF